MSDELLAIMGHVADKRAANMLQFFDGVVESYNDDGTVVVKLQPSGVVTGALPYYTPFAGKPGTKSGLAMGVRPGTDVMVVAFDAAGEDLRVIASAHTDKNPAPGVPEGEVWLVHEDNENHVKLRNDGHTRVGGKTSIRNIAPKVDLTNSDAALSEANNIVRKSDYDALVDEINAMRTVLVGVGYPPGVVPYPKSGCSTVGRAK